jgi:hypothetical protein
MPTSKITDDVELLEARHDSGRGHLALRRDDNNLVTESRANAERQFAPSTIPNLPGCSAPRLPVFHGMPISATLSSSAGTMPRTMLPLNGPDDWRSVPAPSRRVPPRRLPDCVQSAPPPAPVAQALLTFQ